MINLYMVLAHDRAKISSQDYLTPKLLIFTLILLPSHYNISQRAETIGGDILYLKIWRKKKSALFLSTINCSFFLYVFIHSTLDIDSAQALGI